MTYPPFEIFYPSVTHLSLSETKDTMAFHDGAMGASEAVPALPVTGSLRIELPKPRVQPTNPHFYEESSPDDSQNVSPMEEEDIQSAIGISISKAQTRLTSPQTPAVEKCAAMEELGGVFDGSPEVETDEPIMLNEDTELANNGPGQSQTPETVRPHSATLPSPWRATPQSFERVQAKTQAGGPTNMLADLNIKRYMSSFSLPSFPKGASLKDFSVPSLGTILGNVRSHSPSRNGSTRKNRANTVITAKTEWGAAGQRSPNSRAMEVDVTSRIGRREQSQPGAALDELLASELKHNSSAPARAPMIRRSTSDQSLYLRKVTSTATSLGDDTRWENVQEQVNSRAKAIMDSLQDSNIKLPSLPQFPNLSAFRPDFIRNRGQSSSQSSTLANGRSAASESPFRDRPLPQERPDPNEKNADQPPLQANHSHLDNALEQLTGDIVVLGGYRGSILRSTKPPNRQLWVPVKVGLNIRKVNLEVGLDPDDEEKMEESIYPSGMLSHIGPVDMGRRLLKRLRTCKNVQSGKLRVHDYGYDWRLSPHLLSRRLIAFLEKLPCNQSLAQPYERGATVLAHSMGGLLTRHAVNERPELFAGVVYAGVPQHCVNILGPLRNGDEVLLSSKVLTAQVNFTLRSSYLLLPDDGHCFVNKETKEEYPIDFFDPNQWEQYGFSPCVGQIQPGPIEKRSLFGALSDSLPSLPSLALSGKKPSESQTNLADKAASKVSDLVDGHPSGAVDPQLSSPSRPLNTDSTIPKPQALAYLTRTLREVLAFRRELAFKPSYESSNIYPPIALIYANNTPTVCAAQVGSREAIKRADAFDDLKFGSGDGVVLAKAAMLPEGYRAVKGGKVKTERGHVGLLGDLEAVGRCLSAVRRARARERVGLGVEDPQG